MHVARFGPGRSIISTSLGFRVRGFRFSRFRFHHIRLFLQVLPDFSEIFVSQAAFSGLEELLRIYK
jgi:hypothetical protein